MQFLQHALDALPQVATSPLAYLGYVVVVGAWCVVALKTRRFGQLLKKIDKFREEDRADILKHEMGVILPKNISATDWLRSRRQRYLFAGFIAVCILILSIVAMSIWHAESRLKSEAATQRAIDAAHLKQSTFDQAAERALRTNEKESLAGVSTLCELLKDPDSEMRTRALAALGDLLCANGLRHVASDRILSGFNSIDPHLLGEPNLDSVLLSLADKSRTLVAENDLRHKRRVSLYLPLAAGSAEEHADFISKAIQILFAKGARVMDLSNIYLVGAALHGVSMPGARFDGTILTSSDFSNADLQGGSFIAADLNRVSFRSANLQHVVFGGDVKRAVSSQVPVLGFVKIQLGRRAHRSDGTTIVQVAGPDFTSADLRHADFTGFPLFAVYEDDFNMNFQVYGFSFQNAKLGGADFRKAQVYGIFRPSPRLWMLELPIPMRAAGSSGTKEDEEFRTFIGDLDDKLERRPTDTSYNRCSRKICYQFGNSNWGDALLPKAVLTILQSGAQSFFGPRQLGMRALDGNLALGNP